MGWQSAKQAYHFQPSCRKEGIYAKAEGRWRRKPHRYFRVDCYRDQKKLNTHCPEVNVNLDSTNDEAWKGREQMRSEENNSVF